MTEVMTPKEELELLTWCQRNSHKRWGMFESAYTAATKETGAAKGVISTYDQIHDCFSVFSGSAGVDMAVVNKRLSLLPTGIDTKTVFEYHGITHVWINAGSDRGFEIATAAVRSLDENIKITRGALPHQKEACIRVGDNGVKPANAVIKELEQNGVKSEALYGKACRGANDPMLSINLPDSSLAEESPDVTVFGDTDEAVAEAKRVVRSVLGEGIFIAQGRRSCTGSEMRVQTSARFADLAERLATALDIVAHDENATEINTEYFVYSSRTVFVKLPSKWIREKPEKPEKTDRACAMTETYTKVYDTPIAEMEGFASRSLGEAVQAYQKWNVQRVASGLISSSPPPAISTEISQKIHAHLKTLDEMFEASRLQGPMPVEVLVARAWIGLAEVRTACHNRQKLERATGLTWQARSVYSMLREAQHRLLENGMNTLSDWVDRADGHNCHDAKTLFACEDQLRKLRGEITEQQEAPDTSGEQHIESLRRYITRGAV